MTVNNKSVKRNNDWGKGVGLPGPVNLSIGGLVIRFSFR